VRLALRGGDLAGAEKEARERIARSPNAAALRNALVDVLLAAGRLDEAEEECRRALQLDERDVAAVVNLATVFERRNRSELARTVLESARAIDERDPTVWNRLGLLDLAAGDRARALEDFRTAAALGPDYPEARVNHGVLLADAEDFEGATRELEAAARVAPRSAAVWLNLGNAYRGARQRAKAEAAYRRSLELDASLADAELNLALLHLDGDDPGSPALARLEQAMAHLDAYERKGGADVQVASYRKDAARAIEREKKRLAREERDRLRREADAHRAIRGEERGER
jgi:Flp pilus assembly protein TadD